MQITVKKIFDSVFFLVDFRSSAILPLSMKKWIIKTVSWAAIISSGTLFSLEGPGTQNYSAHTRCMTLIARP